MYVESVWNNGNQFLQPAKYFKVGTSADLMIYNFAQKISAVVSNVELISHIWPFKFSILIYNICFSKTK